MFAEYVGLEQDVASHIEARRQSPSETKSDILRRIFREWPEARNADASSPFLDFGQGVRLPAGERLYLYLTKPNSVGQMPDGAAEVRPDGLYLDGRRISPSRGSLVTPAMKEIQRKLAHVNSKGELIMLNAYQHWYVIRGGKLVTIDTLKDPEKRRTRAPKTSAVDVDALLRELGIH
jgi:hypothetical protein